MQGHRVRGQDPGRDRQDFLGRHLQQRRAGLEPHFLLELHGANGGGEPPAAGRSHDQGFGGVDKFKEEFSKSAVGNFGSGWTWLVKTADGSLAIASTIGAGNPLTSGDTPLLTCDVWEHAYYIDYRNLRPKYVEAFWNLVNWKFVAEQFEGKTFTA